MQRKNQRAFTLIELLVVVTLIAILASMSAAAYNYAVGRSRSTKCLMYLRQIGTCAMLYASDNYGRLPFSEHSGVENSWRQTLQPYAEGKNLIFRCPEDPHPTRSFSYAVNDFLTPNPSGAKSLDFTRLDTIPSPSETLYFGEAVKGMASTDHFHFAQAKMGRITPTLFKDDVDVERHGGGANYLYADGRVAHLKWSAVKTELGKTGSRFVRPNAR